MVRRPGIGAGPAASVELDHSRCSRSNLRPSRCASAVVKLEKGALDVSIQEQINNYIADQPESKREDMQALHLRILRTSPNCKLWFLDGRDGENRIVSNPNIGYGLQTIKYANAETKEFYRIGVSANATGISVYLIGIKDKKYISEAYGKRLGKARITGYCIKFRSLKDVNIDILEEIIKNHMDSGS